MTELEISYIFLTAIGIIIGGQLRCEHAIHPINEMIVIVWSIVSIIGLIFCMQTMIPLFYFLNMVTVGWAAYEYLGIYHFYT